LPRGRRRGYSARVESLARARARADAIYDILSPLWPEARPLLEYGDCFQLACAVALSAQTTDEQVNAATPGLFARWPDAFSMARADAADVEAAIRSVGFFRTKARRLVLAARVVEERFGGRMPSSMEELLELPGIGRKSANLILSACFGKPGIIVDTHVLRACLRLGLYPSAPGGPAPDPAAVEARIARLVPEERWTRFSHAVNRHGKHVCAARKPACAEPRLPPCPLLGLCPRKGLPPMPAPARGGGKG
jgi:endonuclease III